MTDAVVGGVGLGLVWGWWLAITASPTRAHTRRAVVVLGASSLALGAGIYLLVGIHALLAATLATGSASTIHVALKGALRRRHRSNS